MPKLYLPPNQEAKPRATTPCLPTPSQHCAEAQAKSSEISQKSTSSTSTHPIYCRPIQIAANPVINWPEAPTNTHPSLTQSDRNLLQSAGKDIGTYATVGSVLGLSLGALLAFRLRRARTQMFAAIRAAERPTHVQFAGGRTEPIPDMTPYMKPTVLGDIATYTFFGAGGLFLFGEMGGLVGTYRARSSILADPEQKKRIETAFRRFRADVLRKEVEALESGDEKAFHGGSMMGGLLS